MEIARLISNVRKWLLYQAYIYQKDNIREAKQLFVIAKLGKLIC